jgi:glucose/arabinose dehydrogenase
MVWKARTAASIDLVTRGVVFGVFVAVALMAPASASAVTLVPLAPASTWGSPPMFLTAPSDDARLFVAERDGVVRIATGGTVLTQPFLTIPNVDTASERGLQSIAFAPDYATSGLLYAFYTAGGPDAADPAGVVGDIRVVEYQRSADPDVATGGRLVLKQAHSAGNHNGGQLAFGHDGLLYVTIGDNANGANSQDLGNLLGKVVRIDPRDPDGAGAQAYSVPASNPFVATAGARREIYALGLRNPFRASIAPNGALVVGDVGSDFNEEVNVLASGGGNYGWPNCEGPCAPPNAAHADPFFSYPHSGPTVCAVIGGHVVRDSDLTGTLIGRYLYGDLCASDLRTLNLGVAGGDPRAAGASLPDGESLQSFGESAGGCAYALSAANVYRVAPDANAPAQCPRASFPELVFAPGRADRTKPRLALRLRKRQRLGRFVTLSARCSERCTLRASGRLRFGAKPKGGAAKAPTKLRRATRRVRANTRVRLRLRTTKPLRKRARKALRAKRGVTARITVVATDAAGDSSRKRVRVKLLLPRPR